MIVVLSKRKREGAVTVIVTVTVNRKEISMTVQYLGDQD